MLLFTTGCASLFPSDKSTSKSRWDDFNAVQADYEKIVPNQTTEADLKAMGFDPYATPNIRILTYIDLVQRFLPNATLTTRDLPEPMPLAIAAKESCHGYEVALQVSNRKRYGNLFLDIFGFRRKAKTTGWDYKAILVMKDSVVVYKLWSGEPMTVKYDDRKRPLGPIQEVDLNLNVAPRPF